MPIYEFKCRKCHNEFEELVMGRDDSVVCPSCRSDKTERLMSACRHKTAGAGGGSAPAAGGGGGCAGCSGGSCATCH